MRRTAPFLTIGHPLHLAIMLAGAVVACSDAPVPVQVRVTLNGVPAPGVEVTAFPYDPGRLLDSLAAAHDAPRPDFGSLEQQLFAFAPDPPAPEDTVDHRVRATRDSAAALADSLRAADRRSPGYADSYRRFRQLYGRLVQRSAVRENARRSERDPVRALALRAGRAADSLRAWEHAAYAGFDSAAAREEDRAGRLALTRPTHSEGWVTLELPPGAWWLEARLEHPENPFAEHVWRVPVFVSGLPFRIPLSSNAARLAWRH